MAKQHPRSYVKICNSHNGPNTRQMYFSVLPCRCREAGAAKRGSWHHRPQLEKGKGTLPPGSQLVTTSPCHGFCSGGFILAAPGAAGPALGQAQAAQPLGPGSGMLQALEQLGAAGGLWRRGPSTAAPHQEAELRSGPWGRDPSRSLCIPITQHPLPLLHGTVPADSGC